MYCTTINLSETGMAVSTPAPLQLGESVAIVLGIPNSEIVISGQGTVVWDDQHGKTGFCVEYSSQAIKSRIAAWLQGQVRARLDAGLPRESRAIKAFSHAEIEMARSASNIRRKRDLILRAKAFGTMC